MQLVEVETHPVLDQGDGVVQALVPREVGAAGLVDDVINRRGDLIAQYENPIQHACDLKEGQVFVANGWERPEGFCVSAWDSMSPFVMTLAHGGGDFYGGWMKNKKSAMISCNDGFRPVSFLLEALETDAE